MHDIVVLLLLSINCYQPETLALNSADDSATQVWNRSIAGDEAGSFDQLVYNCVIS